MGCYVRAGNDNGLGRSVAFAIAFRLQRLVAFCVAGLKELDVSVSDVATRIPLSPRIGTDRDRRAGNGTSCAVFEADRPEGGPCESQQTVKRSDEYHSNVSYETISIIHGRKLRNSDTRTQFNHT